VPVSPDVVSQALQNNETMLSMSRLSHRTCESGPHNLFAEQFSPIECLPLLLHTNLKRWGFLTPPVEGADLRAALEASCLRGACQSCQSCQVSRGLVSHSLDCCEQRQAGWAWGKHNERTSTYSRKRRECRILCTQAAARRAVKPCRP